MKSSLEQESPSGFSKNATGHVSTHVIVVFPLDSSLFPLGQVTQFEADSVQVAQTFAVQAGHRLFAPWKNPLGHTVTQDPIPSKYSDPAHERQFLLVPPLHVVHEVSQALQTPLLAYSPSGHPELQV